MASQVQPNLKKQMHHSKNDSRNGSLANKHVPEKQEFSSTFGGSKLVLKENIPG